MKKHERTEPGCIPFGVIGRLREAIKKADDPRSGFCELRGDLKALLGDAERACMEPPTRIELNRILDCFDVLMKKIQQRG